MKRSELVADHTYAFCAENDIYQAYRITPVRILDTSQAWVTTGAHYVADKSKAKRFVPSTQRQEVLAIRPANHADGGNFPTDPKLLAALLRPTLEEVVALSRADSTVFKYDDAPAVEACTVNTRRLFGAYWSTIDSVTRQRQADQAAEQEQRAVREARYAQRNVVKAKLADLGVPTVREGNSGLLLSLKDAEALVKKLEGLK